MAERSGGEEGWKCLNCTLKLPTGGLAGMQYCPSCKTDVRARTPRAPLQPSGSGALASSSDSPRRAGTEGDPAGYVGNTQSAGDATVPSAADAPRTSPALPPTASGGLDGSNPPHKDSAAQNLVSSGNKKANENESPIEETGAGNEEGGGMTKQQTTVEMARQKREEERRVELQRRQEEKVKNEQQKAEDRRKEQRQRLRNRQPSPTVNDPLQSPAPSKNEGKGDNTGGGAPSGEGVGRGREAQGKPRETTGGSGHEGKSGTNEGGRGRGRGKGGDSVGRGRGGSKVGSKVGRGKGRGGAGRGEDGEGVGQGAGRGSGGYGGGDDGASERTGAYKRGLLPDPSQLKRRRITRKRSREEQDDQQQKSLQDFGSAGASEESFVVKLYSSSSDDDLETQAYRKPEEAEDLFSGTKNKPSPGNEDKSSSAQTESASAIKKEQIESPKYDYRKHPRKMTDTLIGLNAKKSVAVTFHCILPKPLWEWDEHSCMYMRFEGYALGNWKSDVGEFKEYRQLGDGTCEMLCTLNIDANLLNSTWGYKYVVYSPKMVSGDDCFEYLHSFAGKYSYKDPNRCLRINPADLDRTEYHQYDFFVYPKLTSVEKGVFGRAWEGGVGIVRNWLNIQNDTATEDRFTPPSTEKMVKQCLHHYLEPLKRVLLDEDGYPLIFKLDEFVRQVKHIFKQHKELVVQHFHIPCAPVAVDITDEFRGWLEEVATHLLNVGNPLFRFISSVCLACCALDCLIFKLKRAEFVHPLLQMLRVIPNLENKIIPNYTYLLGITSVPHRLRVSQALLHLCKSAMKFNAYWDWLYVVPLCHFLSGSCEPFGNPTDKSREFDARADKFGYKDIKSNVTTGFVTLYTPLEPYFAADPLLLYDFVYLCPEGDFPVLFGKVPAHLSLTRMLTRRPLPLLHIHAMKWYQWLTVIKEKIKNESVQEDICVSTANGAQQLLKLILSQLHITDHQVDVIKSSITLLLYAICKLEILVAQKKLDEAEVEKAFTTCGKALQEWVERRGVIGGGGSSFGYKTESQMKMLYGSTELKLWRDILSLEVPKNRKVSESWNVCVSNVIKGRVMQVRNSNKIGLVYMLEEDGEEHVHPIISSIFMEAATEAIQNMSDYGSLPDFCESERIGKLYGNIFLKKYPNLRTEKFSVQLDDLLSWSYWPNFIKIYSGSSKAKDGLPESCKLACSCAVSLLELVSQQLSTGEITIEELEKINRRLQQMERLCDSVQTETQKLVKGRVHTSVKLRLGEFEAFKEQLSHLQHVCSHLVPHNVFGITEVEGELQKNYRSQKINSLCIRNESSCVSVVCFNKACPLLPFAKSFFVMTCRLNSDVFHSTWTATLQLALTKNPSLDVNHLQSDVWQPAFQQCQSLLEELYEQTITLGDVERHFGMYEESGLTTQLKLLFHGVNECTNHQLGDDWILRSVKKITNYRQLCSYRNAANYFLKLRDLLNLSRGNFRDVERISKEISHSMKDQKLAEITDELVKAGEFLQQFTGEKLDCIRSFCECQKIVEWIRTTTKDVTDLQNFVNVALATAAGGEDDFANDRLSSLRTVGSGFSSLIYNLTPEIGFRELSARCSFVWTAYGNDKNLPKMLASCNKDLEWYKSVKETQASVEVTSFGQMNNIQTCGQYAVGGKRDEAMDTIHDVIHLTLTPQPGKKLLRTSYSLDELRDLESKLVLITGSKAENRAAVDQFLNTLHSVCRIAEVLIKLQQAGNVTYVGWRRNFCCRTLLVEDLQKQAKDMEEELERWNKELTLARQKFYELNYYTTRQLLVLRSELGRLKISGPHQSSWGQVMALLESISSAITLPALAKVVQEVANRSLEDMEEGHPPVPANAPTLSLQVAPSLVPMPPSPVASQFASDKKPLNVDQGLPSLPIFVGLSQEDLDDKQKTHFTDIREIFGYCEMTALKAIEAVPDGDWNDIVNCLEEHAGEWETAFLKSEQIDEEEVIEEEPEYSEDEEMESGSEAEDGLHPIYIDSSPSVVPSAASPSQPQARVVVTELQHIDETNEEVKELLDAEMGTVEECIRAIELYGTAINAFPHMMESQEMGALFQESGLSMLPTSQKPQPPAQEIARSDDNIMISVKSVQAKFLGLEELGAVLRQLNHDFPAAVPRKRKLSDLKRDQPHLLVVPPDQVLRAALSLYMEDSSLPMPTPEEMLICNHNTTAEEVNLLWQRAVCDPGFRRIFCLVHAEKLSYQTADKALRALTEIIQGREGYSLVIICSGLNEEKSTVISKLHLYRRPYGVSPDPTKYRKYLENHFISEHQPSYQELYGMSSVPYFPASVVDRNGSCVSVVSSSRAGMGKTLFISRMVEKLQALMPGYKALITIPVHGPVVTNDSIMECLVHHGDASECTIIHFDISPSVLWQVDTILFSLLVQRGLCDSQGRVWRNHSSQLYAIEVTLPETREKKSAPEHLTLQVLEMLPTVNCVKPKMAFTLMSRDGTDFGDRVVMDQKEFESETFQRVYQYLRRHAAGNNLDRFSYMRGTTEGTPHDCLHTFLIYCGVRDPSWAEIRHFVDFLNLQLHSSERSYFTDPDFVGDVIAGFKSFVVKFMIRMSRDFSTSSLRGEVAQENEEANEPQDILQQYQIVGRKQWEHSSHPYLFFNKDGMSFTFVGFVVTNNGDLCDPAQRGGILERGIMSPQLYTGLAAQRVNFTEDYRYWPKDVMISKISMVMGIEWPYDPDPTYVLTVDNLIKILAIQMRFRCCIPVVIMGETGCGKTRLIRFMCNLASQGNGHRNMLILKVHGGTTEDDIVQFLNRAEESAKRNRLENLDTVVFFDEANTTDAIGLIKEIMCDRRVHGNPVSQDLKFIAACNPYRRHTEEMIKKLRSAGLGFYVRETDTQQKLGKIPLRELVYRVIDLPPSMRPLVYDFGQLNTDTERDYTIQIVHDHVKKHAVLSQQNCSIITAIAHVLAWSQKYMRDRKDECSFVSLRDVERAMIVFIYFFEKMAVLRDPINKKKMKEDAEMNAQVQLAEGPILAPVAVASSTVATDLTRSLILSLSVCYHARLSDRKDYERKVAHEFTAPLVLSGGMTEFRNVMRWSQEVLLESMVLGENIARNTALRENVFMMAVCLDLRIPLFLVGKPGSSKSLAKAIVADSMRGQASQNDLLKSFKQVHMFSYQCSQLSTPQSVIEVFNTAKRFQRNQDTTKYVSVVVLDEVGLAEDSPNLPLKALHPLLEDGTEGSEDRDEVVAREKRVAFIGISNWALDPAKMNRGVMVTRGDPDIDELVLSAQGICHSDKSDAVKDRLNDYFRVLAKAYHEICENQNRQFFGLRDFYSLIKMLYWMCEKTNMPPTGPQLVHAIKRNFGGLEESGVDPETVFLSRLRINIDEAPDLSDIEPEVREFVSPDNTQRGLIKTSLKTKETSWHGENRYLLFLTENYAALEILKQYLQDQEGGHPLLSLQSVESSMKPWEMEPFVLFGSSFPKDKEYTQVCRNINQIKICMEIGRTVILLNLENLYESLYDVLNQYYIHHGGNRYVDLGLQTHKVKCRVHDEFKLILIAEKTTVYNEFPTPLINRLEKHFVLYSSVLEDWQTDVLDQMEQWIEAFSRVQSSNARFKEGDAFVGYQKDVAAAVVFQASSQLRKTCEGMRRGTRGRQQAWEIAWEDGLLGHGSLDQLSREEEGSELWAQAVLFIGQFLLLQTTPPAALVRLDKSRLKDEGERLSHIYRTQHHCSIDDFLTYHLTHDNSRGGLLLQVTTHSHLLSSDEVDELSDILQPTGSPNVFSFLLQEFDTELDFTSKVSPLFVRDKDSQRPCLLIIQCDSGHINGDLIACARYRIYDMRAKAKTQSKFMRSRQGRVTHVVFIIHLPVQVAHSTFVGFQGDPWVSCHIDELRPSGDNAITLEVAQGVTISQLFYGGTELERQTSQVSSSAAFDRMTSAEDEPMEEGGEGEGLGAEGRREEDEEKMEIIVIESESDDELMEGGGNDEIQERDSIKPPHDMQPASAALLGTKTFSDVHTQCVRLNSCVQAAASRLQDSTLSRQRATERVRLLIKVIPRKPTFPLEPDTFYSILVAHIHRMLGERESLHKDDNWVLNEAMDMHNLQTGGTFMNVLTRKLDDIIIPCLAEITAFVDRNCNLSLLQPKPTPLSQFWLRIFASNRAEEALRYIDMVGREKVEMNHENFACEFPFSWLVKELVESHWDSAQSTGGSHRQHVYKQLCSLVSDSPLGDVLLSIIDGEQCEELYRRYLHDFVHSVHRCTHKMKQSVQDEYKLIQDSLYNLVVRCPDFSTIDGNVSLVGRIAAVHIVYAESCEGIHWFGQLTSQSPGILSSLLQSVEQTAGQDDCMMLHLYAVEKILNGLEPPIKPKRVSTYSDDQSLRAWLNNLREASNAIESTLSLSSQQPIALRARLQWQKIQAIQMFTEHVLLNHSNMVVYARQLELALRSESDFLTYSTIEKVKQVLNIMLGKLKNTLKSKEEKKLLSAIRKSCTAFFIEVVSGLCFGLSSVPEDELIIMLLDIVFTEQREVEEGGEGEGGKRGTRNLTPFRDDVADKQPVVRSFLLQLLLEHDTEKVKGHLKTYFNRCQQALVGGMGVDQELSLLCVQCFENSFDKQYSSLSLKRKTEVIVTDKMLTTATDGLVHSAGFSEHSVSLDLLESVARMRYCLQVVTELLQLHANRQGDTQSLYGLVVHRLLEETRRACTNTEINTIDTTGKLNTTGPIVYLLKLLVSQGGFSCLSKIVKDPQFNWIIPKELEQEKEQKTLDTFVIYNPVYAPIREEMSAAAYGRDYKDLEEHTAALQPQECVPFLLSVYEVYTMSRVSANLGKQLLQETITKMNDLVVNCKALSREMKVMARKMVSNEQGGHLAAFQVSAAQTPAQQSLGALVVHVVAALISRSSLDILCPLVTLLNAPGNMAQCYLPTMAEDMLPEARRIITGGQFYECPNGHPYFVGECGRPLQQTNCVTCGSAIGGTNHRALPSNRAARTADTTQTGHSLGHPTTRSNVPYPERSLSPAACCIVRAIMHSALLWTSCNDDSATQGLLALVKSGLHIPRELPEFFWGHLERDVQLLARALGKNPEDAAIVVHLVLRNILTISPPSPAIPLGILGKRDVRNQWEKQFSGLYINPILEKLESELTSAMATILNDDKQDHDPLYYVVYERTPVVKDSLEPHMWGYRPRITLEHLVRYMQQQKKKFPILEEFLKNETVLQATQFIPDIVRLQKLLFDEMHHRIDRKMAHKISMRDFILRHRTENLLTEYQKMVASVQRAWLLVRDKLKDHGQLKVEEEYLKEDLGLTTALEFFIPTTTGPGACTFSLVHYLAYVHNNFMDWCRAKSKTSAWHEHKIQLAHIHKCHLLDYQSQLTSILLSHCHYSLRLGQGREVSYDLPALEKYILDRFIHGKPTILVDIPHVSYQEDIYTAAKFAAVRKKVAPQRALQQRVQQDILRGLGSPDKLRRSLDVVEIVLGFLTSGGGKPKTTLRSYLRKLKMEKRSFSEKAKEHCNLEHILSLWQTLSVGLAQNITLSGQEPFHTLNQELLQPLAETQCQHLDRALPKVDLLALLGTLYEFIETFIRHIDMNKEEWGLVDTLPPHLEASHLEPSPNLDELPNDITLAQTADTWKYIVQFQAKQRLH